MNRKSKLNGNIKESFYTEKEAVIAEHLKPFPVKKLAEAGEFDPEILKDSKWMKAYADEEGMDIDEQAQAMSEILVPGGTGTEIEPQDIMDFTQIYRTRLHFLRKTRQSLHQ